MFGRVISSLAHLGGGSLRKRLYVRITAAAVLLAITVWGIAQMQSASKAAKAKEKQTAAAKKNPSKSQPKKPSTKSTDRRPQPVPGRGETASVNPQDEFNSTYSADPELAGTNNYRSNNYSSNNYRSDENRYSISDDSNYDPSAADDTEQTGAVVSDESEDTADTESNETSTESSHTSSSTDSQSLLQNLVNGTQASDDAEDAQQQQQQYSVDDERQDDGSRQSDTESDIASDDENTEEPGRLLIPIDDDPDDDASAENHSMESGSSEDDEELVEVDQQRAAQPLRSANTRDASTTRSAPPPPLLGNMSRVSPLSESSSSTDQSSTDGSTSTPSVALPPTSGIDVATSPELEGVQVPSMYLEKTAPDEVQVGRPARFQIFVRNVGKVTANNVTVTDRVPEGAVLVETTPPAENSSGTLVWNLGTMEPGAEAQLTLTVTPQVEGYIGSVAQVTFAAQAAARTISTKPVLKLEIEAPDQVLIGDWVNVLITVRNDGTGPARGVVIEDDVPEGLSHPAGRELEHELGTLRPREQRQLNLVLAAEKAGTVTNVIRVHDDGDLQLSESATVNVVAPKLTVGIEGPKLRYLERQATYHLGVTNDGTATANNVELVAWLPPNLQFVSAEKLGQYDAQQHAVYWNLEELPPQKTGAVKLVTLPVQEGTRELRVEAHADLTSSEPTKHEVTVDSISELSFSIADTSDPIEIGSDTVYEIEVVNQGSKTDRDIVLAMLFPEELQPVKGEGPTQATVSGQQVQFQPLGQLAAGANVIFRVQAQGRLAGDARILVQLTSEQRPKPVSKEESTKVYSD